MQQWFPFFGNFRSNSLGTLKVCSLFLLAEDTNSIRLKAPKPSIEVTQSLQNHSGWEPCSAWGSQFLHTTNCPTLGSSTSLLVRLGAAPRPCPQPQMDVNQSRAQQGAPGSPDTLHSPTAPMPQELWVPTPSLGFPEPHELHTTCSPWPYKRSAVPKLSESPELRSSGKKEAGLCQSAH